MRTGLRTAAPSAVSRGAVAVSRRPTGQPDNRLFLPVREVAQMFDVSRSTIVRAYQAGEFPAIKFRGTYRVPSKFVRDFHAAALHGHVLVVEDYAKDWIARHGMPAEVAA